MEINPLDALIADMIAETGVPDAEAERWVDNAMMVARTAAAKDPEPPAQPM